MHTIFLTSKCTRISVRNSLHRCKWRFEGDAHHRAVGFTSISSRPTTELLPTLQNSWKITYSEPFYRQTPNPPMMLGGNQSIGCVISIWEGLTFMSFMMIWKSPPKALHSFSIPASILPHAPRWHLSSLWKLASKPAVNIWRVLYEAVFEGYRVNKAKADKLPRK